MARGATEVEVDLITPTKRDDTDDGSTTFVELPGNLFVARNSLARLALGGFSLGAILASPAAGLAGLCALSLSHDDVTGEAVHDVVSSCRALEFLSLSSCNLLKSIRITSETLRVLEIVRCPTVRELRVTAPALESFAFHGDIFYVNDNDGLSPAIDLGPSPLALRDAYLSLIGFGGDEGVYDEHEYAYGNLLSCVARAQVWTLCSIGLRHMWAVEYVDMTNIRELQLLMASVTDDDDLKLEGLSSFFQYNPLPLLDRLFVRFPGHVTDASEADAAAALAGEVVDDSKFKIYFDDFVLDSLSLIKLMNFRGARFELQLLAFVLRRAPALEQLVLVAMGEEGRAHPGPGDERPEVIQRQVSAMRKASPQARLTVCRSSQDRSQNPVHTSFYHEE